MIAIRAITMTLLLLLSCEFNRQAAPAARSLQVTAAARLTQRYSQSQFASWHVHASAAGRNCDVLLIDTSLIMADAMVEAMHYGAGSYEVYAGGVRQFCRDRAFRGVAYRDASGRIWTYGNVPTAGRETLAPCH